MAASTWMIRYRNDVEPGFSRVEEIGHGMGRVRVRELFTWVNASFIMGHSIAITQGPMSFRSIKAAEVQGWGVTGIFIVTFYIQTGKMVHYIKCTREQGKVVRRWLSTPADSQTTWQAWP